MSGGEAVRITDDTYTDWSPVWSSDGTHLYFASDRGGSMSIWRVRVDEQSGNMLGTPAAVTTGGSGSRPQLVLSRDMSQTGRKWLSTIGAKANLISSTRTSRGPNNLRPLFLPMVKRRIDLKLFPGLRMDGVWLELAVRQSRNRLRLLSTLSRRMNTSV